MRTREFVPLLGIIASVLAGETDFFSDRIVGEDEFFRDEFPDPDFHSVPLISQRRSPDAHRRLVDWITSTHTRRVHPIRLINEDDSSRSQKIITETPLKNADLVEYYAQVDVGGQHFAVVCDTGSGILWVPGNSCSDSACTSHHQLKVDDSIHVEDGDVSIKYGTGHMSGRRAVANIKLGQVQVKRQDFLISTKERGEVFDLGKFDGVLGLGRKFLASILRKEGDSKGRANPFYMNAIHQKLLRRPIFSFFVSKNENKPGALVLGGTNKKLYNGDIHWHKGNSRSYWMMNVDEIACGHRHREDDQLVVIDTTDQGGMGMQSLRAIADSGTSLLVGPPKFIKPLLKHVNVHSDCSNMHKLMTIHITMRDVKGKRVRYHLTPEDYVMKRDGSCKTGIAVMHLTLPGNHPIVILGDTFLRAYYSVYNSPENLIGFARANHDHEAGHKHIPSLVDKSEDTDDESSDESDDS